MIRKKKKKREIFNFVSILKIRSPELQSAKSTVRRFCQLPARNTVCCDHLIQLKSLFIFLVWLIYVIKFRLALREKIARKGGRAAGMTDTFDRMNSAKLSFEVNSGNDGGI